MPFEGMGAAVASLAGKFGKKKKEEEGDYESNKKKYGAGRAREMESKHKTLAGSLKKYQGGEEAHTAVEKYQGGGKQHNTASEAAAKQKTASEVVRGRKPEKKKTDSGLFGRLKRLPSESPIRKGRLQRPTPGTIKTHDGTGRHRPINMA